MFSRHRCCSCRYRLCRLLIKHLCLSLWKLRVKYCKSVVRIHGESLIPCLCCDFFSCSLWRVCKSTLFTVTSANVRSLDSVCDWESWRLASCIWEISDSSEMQTWFLISPSCCTIWFTESSVDLALVFRAFSSANNLLLRFEICLASFCISPPSSILTHVCCCHLPG